MALYSLGEYSIIKELGKGGMGVVYLAEHQRLQKKYAIKVLPEKFSQDKELIERFHTEARVMAELNHPNIVKVVNMSCKGTTYYLVMDYVESETGSPKTLHDYVREQGGKLPEEEAERVALDILNALEYAHSYSLKAAPKGIIHRDIKPANILLDEKGTAKVADFGLAKILAGDHPSATKKVTLTAEGEIMGTYDFMSPEQKEGKRVDLRTDIYAVGVIIYAMLTGKKPGGRFSLPSAINPELSKKWDKIVDKCLQNLPENRFQSAGEVIKAIKEKEAIKPKKEKKAHRGWLAELIRYTAIIIIVIIIAGVVLTYVLFKNEAFLSMMKDSVSLTLKEMPKEGEKEVSELPQQKVVPPLKPAEQKPGQSIEAKIKPPVTPPVTPPEPVKEPLEVIIKIPDLEKLGSDDFLKALREASTRMKEGLEAESKEFSQYYKKVSDQEKLILDMIIGLGSDFMKADRTKPREALKDFVGLVETIKKDIPPEGPIKNSYEEAINKVEEAKQYREKGDLTKAQESYKKAQMEMRKIFVLQRLKQEADQVKVVMEKAKKEVEEVQPSAGENVLYRTAAKTGEDADAAYQKGDYARAKTLYTIAGNIFKLSAQDCRPLECMGILRKFVEKTKAEADQMNASSLASELYNRASMLEERANSAFDKKAFRNAAVFYVESAFFYERAKERISRERALKNKGKANRNFP